MAQYIVTVKYNPAGSGIFDKGIEKFRVEATDEEAAKIQAKKHSFFPIGGEIIRVRYAAYKRK